jgi:hypothetical protein
LAVALALLLLLAVLIGARGGGCDRLVITPFTDSFDLGLVLLTLLLLLLVWLLLALRLLAGLLGDLAGLRVRFWGDKEPELDTGDECEGSVVEVDLLVVTVRLGNVLLLLLSLLLWDGED